jgi:hypothetical protein
MPSGLNTQPCHRWALVMPVMSLGLMMTLSTNSDRTRRFHSMSLDSQTSRTGGPACSRRVLPGSR